MILETIIGALVPVGVEGIKQLIGRFNGGVRPTTIAEQIQLDNSEIARLEADSDFIVTGKQIGRAHV